MLSFPIQREPSLTVKKKIANTLFLHRFQVSNLYLSSASSSLSTWSRSSQTVVTGKRVKNAFSLPHWHGNAGVRPSSLFLTSPPAGFFCLVHSIFFLSSLHTPPYLLPCFPQLQQKHSVMEGFLLPQGLLLWEAVERAPSLFAFTGQVGGGGGGEGIRNCLHTSWALWPPRVQ